MTEGDATRLTDAECEKLSYEERAAYWDTEVGATHLDDRLYKFFLDCIYTQFGKEIPEGMLTRE